MSDIDAIWRFIPTGERMKLEKIAEIIGASKGAAVSLKMCADALRDYCPPAERAKVLGALAAQEVQRDDKAGA